MQNDRIIIRGATENNLQNVSLEIPKHQITVVTGVSGSGKSSLVMDTIAAKSRRELNDTFPTFVQQYLPKYGRPHVEAIENLPIAIVIDQKKPGNNSRSTVGTYTDIYALLRLLFSRVGQPFVGYAESFSFNHPDGSCPRCSGLGEIRELDIHKLVDFDKSLNDEDTIHYIAFGKGGWRWIRYAHSGLFDLDKKIKDYSPEELELFLHSPQIRLKNPPSNWPKSAKYEGLIPRMYRSIINSEEGLLHSAVLNPMLRMGTCPDCGGTRLNEKIRSCRIQSPLTEGEGLNIAEVCALSIMKANQWVRSLTQPLAQDLKQAITARLSALEEIGLGYLSLDRAVGTLSGGEAQRCKIAKYINSSLSDVLYILDEPSTGLHNHDIELMKHSVRRLRDAGNTVLIVEHHREMIRMADHIVDMGPGPGSDGGHIVFEGTYDELLQSDTDTGRCLRRASLIQQTLPQSLPAREGSGCALHLNRKSNCPPPSQGGAGGESAGGERSLSLRHATLHNLQDISIDLPMGSLCVICGVAGSGKSSLMESLRSEWSRLDSTNAGQPSQLIYISQKDIGVSLRSTPATYMDVAGDIRKLFARKYKKKETDFAFNGKGACPVCGGKGVVVAEMAFMDNIETPCEACHGLRYSSEVLKYKIESVGESFNIAQVMDFSVRRAIEVFQGTPIAEKLQPMMDVGLGYLHLNQALSTLSGGELRRLKMASMLGEEGRIFIIDEPTDGLHAKDVNRIVQLFRRMVAERGNTVYVIEHNTDVIRAADYVVELGPGAGEQGGRVIFQGTPEELTRCQESLTARYL
ncbi:MAG: excinuclease ABC subunit UvrA [Bacteroidaceae bacterium]|nr:excinuclease ABC subunit UvrA [Bacteroidaceae bacterium]